VYLAKVVVVGKKELHVLEGALGSLKARATRSDACSLLLGPAFGRCTLLVLSAILIDPSVCVFMNVVF
jgi:hypothetical protein